MSDDDKTASPADVARAAQQALREARLAKALRDNLRRRKAPAPPAKTNPTA